MDEMSYLYFGERDLKEAGGVLSLGYFSTAGRLAQQAVEKHLKQFIQNNGDTNDISILASHNTVILYDKVVMLGGLTYDKNSHRMMSVLRNYYYDTNYPGADARELGEEEAADAVEFAKELISSIKWQNEMRS